MTTPPSPPPPQSPPRSPLSSPAEPTGQQRTARTPRWRAWVVWLVLPVALAALSWAGLRFGLPPLVQWAIEKHGSEALGRRLTVGAVEFEPGTLTLRLRDLAMAAARSDAPQAQAQVARIEIDLSAASLWRLAPVLDAVLIEAPRIRLQHLGEGRSDIDDLRKRFASPPSDAQDKPPRFRVGQFRLEGGELSVSDAPSGAVHALTALGVHTGVISGFDGDRDQPIEARLQAKVDGTPLQVLAKGAPWATQAQMAVQLTLQGLPLRVLQPHWPRAWPLQVQDGTLTLNLQAEVPLAAVQRSVVSGQIGLTDVRVAERSVGAGAGPGNDARPLLTLPMLSITLDPSRVAEGELKLAQLKLQQPQLRLQRNARGELNLERIARGFGGTTGASSSSSSSATATASASPPALQPRIQLALLDIDQAELQWQDGTLQPAARLKAQGLKLVARDMQWPDLQPVPFEGEVRVEGAALRWQGRADLKTAEASLEVQKFALQTLAPYLAPHLKPQLLGQLGAKARIQWKAGDGPGAGMQVESASLELRDLQLREGAGRDATVVAGWRVLRIDDAAVDLNRRALRVGRVALEQPAVAISRSAEGHWMAQDWLREAATPPSSPSQSPSPSPSRASTASSAAPAARTTPAASPDWRWQLGDLRIRGGQASFVDRQPVEPVELNLGALDVQWRGPTRPGQATPLQVSADVQALRSRRDPAPIRYRGELRLPSAAAPLQLRGQLQAERLPLHVVEPYAREQLNLDLRRADTSWRGTVDVSLPASGVQLELRGDAAIEELRASTLSPREDLLDWKSLSLRGVEVSVADGALRRLSVAETALQDFFARVIIDNTGRINLQDLLRKPAAPSATISSAEPAASTSSVTSPAVSASPASASAPTPEIRFGPIALVNGRVFLSDRFIQPNYSANLSELTGSLGAFANAAASGGQLQMAPLSLRGRAEGTATVEIAGQLNPLAQPLALDLQGRVRELELPPLSPYSSKYAGHGIERGKLSLDLEYRIAPDGQLTASNRIVLNQLVFGERIEGSEAPNLPLRLAVALLSDRNGVIDINLPIGGSINDPQFRLGPIIWKLVLNLIGKAITAPFALIAQAFSAGAGDPSHVMFEPGSAALSEAARERLGQLAQALRDRPALQLTVVGEGDPQAEQTAWQRRKLDERVRAEKRRQQARDARAAGQSVSTSGLPEPTVTPAEYPALLREVYRRADIAKPRNLVGLPKDLPVPEMEALLMASIPADANVMRDLVLARSVAVRDHLTAQGIASERLFLGAPLLKSESTAGRADGAPPRAELKPGLR